MENKKHGYRWKLIKKGLQNKVPINVIDVQAISSNVIEQTESNEYVTLNPLSLYNADISKSGSIAASPSEDNLDGPSLMPEPPSTEIMAAAEPDFPNLNQDANIPIFDSNHLEFEYPHLPKFNAPSLPLLIHPNGIMDANISLLDSENSVVDDLHHYDLPDSDTPSSPVRHTQDVMVADTDEAQCSSINTIQDTNMPLLNSDDSVDDPHYLPDSDTSSDQPLSKIRRKLKKTSTDQSGDVAEVVQPDEQYTKRTGELRKRKKFCKTVAERNADKLEKVKTKHTVRTGCGPCKKGCVGKIVEDQRISINRDYWMMSWQERQIFLSATISTMEVKRRRGSGMSRTRSCKYFLKNANGEKVEICKVFFLTTLGYDRKNDRAITNIINKESNATSVQDKRGKHPKTPKTDRSVIKTHIESFGPTISHYRREHAPNKRYLASDINITNMHKDLMAKYPDIKCSYELYRKCVSKDCNISFTKLGHEECETCEIFKMHDPKHTQQNLIPDCESCKAWENHISKAKNAREKYRTDAANAGSDETSIIVSADLEKVIMLPRIDMFKQVIFCQRIIVFNESFVPIGKKQQIKPFACLWHECISGRKKEDLISTFHVFLIAMRDFENITIWLDNCSGQNKNWALFSYLTYIINSPETATNKLTLRYFEPGHTFMAADSFHHQVELSLQQKKKVYDFADFVNCVQAANSGKVAVKEMKLEDFFVWPDNSSSYKIKQLIPRPYMKDIVEVIAERGKNELVYRTSFDAEVNYNMNFLNKKAIRRLDLPPRIIKPRGITNERKRNIEKHLLPLIPQNRRVFWETLPVDDNAIDLRNSDDKE
ncbi:uncharacterized protein LOC115885491 [Sitophilus oryzae]|uniref:Uncharacterized protein LOC115877030 n=1 Tax=Sitophilus oryzae TaxID=7048 RepID=A0A6J2XRG0_SITOR|nr:uncharacterized protein LOC115877030 [Sitophilus oryzae]XP_030753219.1 uncharacterized protein LOC115880212 [Sitophilus oryzae]XP_030760293.1 uncharacterized protein LOC115885491 [Sitophilus oryzae]